MAGERLNGAKKALIELVDRLDPADRFGLITFDDHVRVEIAAAPLKDKAEAKNRISGRSTPGGIDRPVRRVICGACRRRAAPSTASMRARAARSC